MNLCTNSYKLVKKFFTNFVHEFEYQIRMNFLQEKLVMLRMACTVFPYQMAIDKGWLPDNLVD